MVHSAALGVKQANHRIEIRVSDIAICRSKNGLRPIIVIGFLHFGSDIIERFIPADALPLILAAQLPVRIIGAPVFALHGIFNASRREHVADLCTSAWACSTLRNLNRVLVLLIGAKLQRHAIFNVHPQKTT